MVDDDSPRQKSASRWIILILVLLLLGGGAASAWFFFLKGMVASSPYTAANTVEKQDGAPVAVSGIGVPLPEFTTNLADPLGQRFIRIDMEVEVANAKAAEEMLRLNARVRDSIILLLSSKTYADVAGAENKMLLKSEITDRLNTILGPGKIYQVFITNMVIQ